ncbi:hypothetical protein GCM10009682_08240 [Luedemannella flava]|uniref:DUF3592 domain-containing protein n=1 Tax=Luedemannella flava TaxID=349316 RepID=A0ABN2LH28_9ACTN
MHVGRFLGVVWVPVAAALGPVISQRHGVTQYIGGAVAISAPFVAAWVCHRLDDRRAGQPAYAVVRSGPAPFVGLVVGILCVLGAYGNAERFYGSQFTYEAAVRVIGSGCYEVGDVCVEYAILGRPDDGTRLPLEMFDVAKGLRAGDTLTVRWDKNNYASPVPTTYPVTGLPYDRSPAPVPLWGLPGIALLYLGVVVYYARRGRQRRKAAAALERRQRLRRAVTRPLRRRVPSPPQAVAALAPPSRSYPTRR